MKKFFIFLSFFILTSSVFANTANPTLGGWQVISNIGQGIGAKLTATKEVVINGASKTVTSVASVSPNPIQVGKFLAKASAVSVAIDALDYLLDGVDYVMDPANNSIRYKQVISEVQNDGTLSEVYQYKCRRGGNPIQDTVASCANVFIENYDGGYLVGYNSCTIASASNIYCVFRTSDNRTLNFQVADRVTRVAPYPQAETENKSIPLNEVGSRVIEQAEKDIKAGNPTSPAVVLTRAVAQDIIQEQAVPYDPAKPLPSIPKQFEENATFPSEGTVVGEISGTDPTTGEPADTPFSMQFPDFCGWASTVCAFIDWMKKEHDIDDVELPTKELDEKEIEDDLVRIASNSCPAPVSVEIPLPVFGTVFTDSVDISPYCSEIKNLAPVLQLITFVICVMILARI